MPRPTDPPTPSPTPEKQADPAYDDVSGPESEHATGAGALRHGVLLEVAYDGTAYHGWAAQKNARAVEERLFGAVTALAPRVGARRGASRTDAGVHAEGQLVA